MPQQTALAPIIRDVVAPAAAGVDRTGAFPREAVEALRKQGFLGLTMSSDAGGGGEGIAEAADVVEQLARACASTAMVVAMHYAAASVLDAHGGPEVRHTIASGAALCTLAFSEAGSRSHFWAPMSTAAEDGEDTVRIDARKSWVTSAGEADLYVWSSRPLAAAGPMTLWCVPATTAGIRVGAEFDGLGLRGNASRPVLAEGAPVARGAMIGGDGDGLDLALQVVLPWFLVLNAAASIGLMEAVTAEAIDHLARTRLEHLNETLAQQQVPRLDLARMRIETDRTRTLVDDAIRALEGARSDAMLRVLEVKAAAAEAAVAVTDLAMKVAGGAAFRKELGIERCFRDARAARVMAPTTDALLDFIGRAITGLPLLEQA